MSVVGGDRPPGATTTSYDVGSTTLAAVEVRPRDPRGTVLLIPGFTGSKEDFFPLLPALADGGWHCISLDQRGQHESPGTDDPSDYTVDALATDVLEVVRLLGRPVHLVGHSFGGLVSRAAVIAEPAAFRSLVLMSSGPAALSGPRVEGMDLVRPLVEAGDLEQVADLMDAASALDPRRVMVGPELRAFLRRRFLASHAGGLIAMADALTSEPDRVDALRATGVPVLVLLGEHDDAWLPPQQRDTASRLGAHCVVLPEAWHSPAAEQPQATAQALLSFWA